MKWTLVVSLGLVGVIGLGTAVAQPGRNGTLGREGHGPRGLGPQSPGPATNMLDVDGDGLVSLAEFLVPAQDHFASLDVGSDGFVALAEFIVPPAEHFGELDTDSNGALTRDELRPPVPAGPNGMGSAHCPPPPRMPRGGPENPMLDTDSNGLVSLAEFLAPAEEHFTSLDANDDNLLSMAEFVAPAETHFNQLDVDGDGQLSQDEFHPRQPRPRGNGGGPRRNGAMGGAVGR